VKLHVEHSGWPDTYGPDAERRMGFFTDTSVCIGCKACEVACKEWNEVPEDGLELTGDSYDNTGELSANTWRHVAFIEQRRPIGQLDGSGASLVQEAALGELQASSGLAEQRGADGLRWLMSSDVCKHCTEAACLDVCPTGSIFRTEFATVVVQEDICNGCGYCVVACPFGVLSKREDDGRVFKCTLCYDRLKDGMEPACAQACPTDSIQFGPLDELLERAGERLDSVRRAGETEARLYGAEADSGVGGTGSVFLLLDEPEVYGLPPDPVATTRHLGGIWRAVAAAALTVGAAAWAATRGAPPPGGGSRP
jgi:formate dehydrogenase iron-sulfur subunit